MYQSVSDPVTLAYHELRSPLGLMVTAANSLADDAVDETVKQRCDAIARAAERMLRVANQVLFAGEAAPTASVATFAPSAVVANVVREYASLGLRIELDSMLWASEVRSNGAAEQFEALVSSLVMNAQDHCEPGSVIQIRCSATDDVFTLVIENEVAATEMHRGLQLGTAIVRDLARKVGASVHATSDGTCYRVSVSVPARSAQF